MSHEPIRKPPAITGRVVLAVPGPVLRGATLHVYLEDVSYADAPAPVIAETELTNVNHPAPGRADLPTELPFVVALAEAVIDPSARYAVRAWVDADGDGQTGPGDRFSDQAYPVLTRGFGTSVVITLT